MSELTHGSFDTREKESTHSPTPHALTREQVEEYTSRFYACGFLYMKKVFEDHDAALRHALTQQAQELESTRELNRISAVALSEKEQQLATMTAERDEIAARWKHDFELRCDEEEKNEQLNKQLAASQQKVRELEEHACRHDTAELMAAERIRQLQATLAARERRVALLEEYQKLCEGIEDNLAKSIAENEQLAVERDTARQDAARLRTCLIAHMGLAAKICYAEPELTEYRTITQQAHVALKVEP